MMVSIVCDTKSWGHPCHRLVFIVNDWLERDATYVSSSIIYFMKGQLSAEKISNTGEFPVPLSQGFANFLVNYLHFTFLIWIPRTLLFFFD